MRSPLLLGLFALCALSARATDRLVVPGGGGGTFATIQSAIDASSAGDRILVSPAVYTEDLVIVRGMELLSNNASQRFTVNGHVDVGTVSGPVLSLANAASAVSDWRAVGGGEAGDFRYDLETRNTQLHQAFLPQYHIVYVHALLPIAPY